MADKKNIIVGAAQFYVGGASASKPAAEANKSYGNGVNGTIDATVGWTNVGYTQEGVEVSYEPEYGDVEVDQLLDSARTFKSGMRVTVNTTFAEATLENLVIAWGQTDSTLVSSSDAGGSFQELTIQGGNLGDAPLERQLIIVGNGKEKSGAGFYNERTYHAYRALSTETTSFALRRNEATVYPVSFRLLPHNDPQLGYGAVRDRVRTW